MLRLITVIVGSAAAFIAFEAVKNRRAVLKQAKDFERNRVHFHRPHIPHPHFRHTKKGKK